MTEVHDLHDPATVVRGTDEVGADRPAGLDAPAADEHVAEPVRLTAPRARGLGWLAAAWPPLLLGVALLGVWYLVTYVVLDDTRRFLMPAPHAVLTEGFLGESRQGRGNVSVILDALQRTATVSAIGLGLSIIIGMSLAVVMSQSPKLERAVFPFAVMLQATPILALVPLIGFWFGYSTNPRVIVCVLISLFPILVNTLFGLQSAERSMHDLFTLHRASRLTRLRKLMFPAGLPAIFAGLRISAGLSVIGAIVGDFFFGQGTPGLGQVLKRANSNGEGELLFATVIVACALGVAVFLFFGWLGRRVTGRWYDAGAAT